MERDMRVLSSWNYKVQKVVGKPHFFGPAKFNLQKTDALGKARRFFYMQIVSARAEPQTWATRDNI